jgi:hypothetical protein
MHLIMAAAVSVALLAPVAAQAQDDALNLICFGTGAKLEGQPTNTLEWDRYDHKYRVKNGYETQMRDFETAVTVQIQGNDGRIRLPKKLVPPINSGGDDQHWWQLDDVRVTGDTIDAGYRLNGMNKPKIKIDRTTGAISIKGFGQNFTGRCDKADAGQRRF